MVLLSYWRRLDLGQLRSSSWWQHEVPCGCARCDQLDQVLKLHYLDQVHREQLVWRLLYDFGQRRSSMHCKRWKSLRHGHISVHLHWVDHASSWCSDAGSDLEGKRFQRHSTRPSPSGVGRIFNERIHGLLFMYRHRCASIKADLLVHRLPARLARQRVRRRVRWLSKIWKGTERVVRCILWCERIKQTGLS